MTYDETENETDGMEMPANDALSDEEQEGRIGNVERRAHNTSEKSGQKN